MLPLGNFQHPMGFIVGCGRSGTTLLGEILARHPQVCYLREPIHIWHIIDRRTDIIGFFGIAGSCWLNEADLTERSQQIAQRLFGQYGSMAKVLVEKLPTNAFRMEWLEGLLKTPKFLSIIRDGRDVVSSGARISKEGNYKVFGKNNLHQWWGRDFCKWKTMAKEGREKGYFVSSLNEIKGNNDYEAMAAYEWLVSVRSVWGSVEKLGIAKKRFLEIRYEDLVNHPLDIIERIETYLGIDLDQNPWEYAKKNIRPQNDVGRKITLPKNLYEDFCLMQEELDYDCNGVSRR